MDLINLALQYRDYEWVKELLKLEKSEEAEGKGVKPDKTEERVKVDIFNEESIALEAITSTYAVKEKSGLRAFNINSEYDRNMSDIVFVEKPAYKRGEKVSYRVPTNEEIIFARGMVNGYVTGYGEANNRLNSQLMEYFNAFEVQDTKKRTTGGKKTVKAKKSKVPKQ
jgi:hypothetical protein